jgi:hypothetical protein
MVNIQYNHPNIRVETQLVSKLFNTPLKVSIVSHIGQEEVWSCELNDYSWATHVNDSIFDIIIKDSNNQTIITRKWDVINDGSYLDKALYLYCKNTPNTSGVAIGTHDGEFGEWVSPVVDNITQATLIEASSNQFKRLSNNYKGYSNVKLIKNLITTDGRDTEFFEGGRGYTNSVKEQVINSWEIEPISSSILPSIPINEILKDKVDWLHLDIEGYDAEILKSVRLDLLPNFIIFEHNNLSIEDKISIEQYLTDQNYTLWKNNPVSYLALKNV